MSASVERRSNPSAGSSIAIKVNLPSVNNTVAAAASEAKDRLIVLHDDDGSGGVPNDKDSKEDLQQRTTAARRIERFWLRMRDRQLFKLLKSAICAAEQSLTCEILRKVCAREATLLRDKSMNTKVRFRFGGLEFPPHIYFKIYTCTSTGTGVKYVSGKKMIEPASQAARDSCGQMGHRQFYEQIIKDKIHNKTYKITDQVDVTTLKDYMQYLSLLDETPAYLGGKDNSWRKLSLEVVPRQTIFYDIVHYIHGHQMTAELRTQLPILMALPVNEDIQREQIKIITQYRPNEETIISSSRLRSASRNQKQETGRRSKKACQRAEKMRSMYQKENTDIPVICTKATYDDTVYDDWEDDEHNLYEWTQQLSMDNLTAMTPQLQPTPY